QRYYLLDKHLTKIKRTLQTTFSRTDAYNEVIPLLNELFDVLNPNVASFNIHSLTTLARRLDIGCKFLKSSELEQVSALRGEAKVIAICQEIGANMYVNPIGGAALYDAVQFEIAGLDLSFLRTCSEPASLVDGAAQLSIIDSLMHLGFN